MLVAQGDENSFHCCCTYPKISKSLRRIINFRECRNQFLPYMYAGCAILPKSRPILTHPFLGALKVLQCNSSSTRNLCLCTGRQIITLHCKPGYQHIMLAPTSHIHSIVKMYVSIAVVRCFFWSIVLLGGGFSTQQSSCRNQAMILP